MCLQTCRRPRSAAEELGHAPRDAAGVEAELGVEAPRIAGLAEGHGADALERDRTDLREPFGDGAAEAAGDRVILHRHDAAGPGRRATQHLLVERLDRRRVDDLGRDALALEKPRRLQRVEHGAAGGDQRDVRARPQQAPAAETEPVVGRAHGLEALTRQSLEPVCPPDYRFRLGRWCLLRPGTDVTLIATGGTVFNALQAARLLEREGISAEVVNASSIKPLDEEMLGRSAARTGRVVTVEDHSIAGGLGGAVAEWLSEVRPIPLKRIGTAAFGESGDPRGLYAKFGFDPGGIARSVAKFLGR